ncbi:T9SS type A sorting domain-containing protein [Algibacter sp. L1A34]|uniref:T9SS type A sorting domain-containing protein n=1 Tax=Algibacter sp. L1A34 TaxID=2686365 RepID=UPI00131CBF50|nr:T9SS type A sorting domain-containing protein [Algibacter sp. L1A34]
MTTQKLYVITTLLLIANQLNAQYVGGIDDGSDKSALHGSRLSGEIASFTVLYQGSSGDGFDNEQNQVVLSNSNFEIYNGNVGDGFSQNVAALVLNGNALKSLYSGRYGDGYTKEDYQTILNGQNLSMLYSGNIGDGATYTTKENLFLKGFMLQLFNGGNGDGYASLLSSNNYLNGLMLTLYSGGNGDGFAVNKLTSALTLDLIEQLLEMNVLIYPNPASQIVHIKPDNGVTITSIELYDVSGKKMFSELSNENTIDISNLSDGIYLLNMFSEKGSVTKKLIVKNK